MSEKIKILYLDDEYDNLTGFKASFRIDYTIFIAINVAEALEHLKNNPDIRIIFCDQRMPEKTGVEFFEEVRSQYPEIIRILITGYTDIESVIDAVNKGNIYRYVKKPWADSDIITAIYEANKFYVTNSMLALKNQELQRAYEELDKFAYSVTHDIRRPLLSILGVVDVAQHIDNIEEIREMLVMMEESVKNLDNFIQNVHDYYSLKRGDLTIEEINFNEIVKEQEDLFRITSSLNNINFVTKVDQNETFRSDKMSLTIILTNLLSNALKYQRRDNNNKSVELNIEVGTGSATISVKDNGIGIPEKHIGEIFNMFFRATSEEVGSGFGLYNVKDALLKLNGEIFVNSIIREGTTFTVNILNK